MSARIIVETEEGVVVFRAEAEYRDLLLATPSFSNAKARSLWAGIRGGVRDVEAIEEGRDPERPSEKAMRLAMAKLDGEGEEKLIADGWRKGPRDGLWRNDRFGGSYKMENALRRIGSQDGEETS